MQEQQQQQLSETVRSSQSTSVRPRVFDGLVKPWDRCRYLVHRVSARIETSFAGLTLEQHIGYTRKANMEAPTEIEIFKSRRHSSKNLEGLESPQDANHNKSSSHDVQGSAPGRERPRTRAFQTLRRFESMEELGGLAVCWHEQQLTKQTFWTAGLLDEVEGDILEARYIAFVMGYLDEEEAGAIEQERLPLRPTPPPTQPTSPRQPLPPAK